MYALPNISRTAGAVPYRPVAPVRGGFLKPLSRIRFQLLGGLLVAVAVPALLRGQFSLRLTYGSLENSAVATALALLLGAYVLRRMLPLPGVQATSFVLPTFVATYGGSLLSSCSLGSTIRASCSSAASC